MRNEPGQLKSIRKARTFDTCRARNRAAARASMPFFLLPALFNPAPYMLLLSRSARHVGIWSFAPVYIGWVLLMCASLAFGVYRRQGYLRDHPISEA
jgi:hypothetical protein